MANKTPIEWALINVEEYDRCLQIWEKSLEGRTPNYNALIGAYKHLYGAEINFLDAKDGQSAREASILRKHMAKVLEKIMEGGGAKRAASIWMSSRWMG